MPKLYDFIRILYTDIKKETHCRDISKIIYKSPTGFKNNKFIKRAKGCSVDSKDFIHVASNCKCLNCKPQLYPKIFQNLDIDYILKFNNLNGITNGYEYEQYRLSIHYFQEIA